MVKHDHFRGMFDNHSNPLKAAENHCAAILNSEHQQREARKVILTQILDLLRDEKPVQAALILQDILYND